MSLPEISSRDTLNVGKYRDTTRHFRTGHTEIWRQMSRHDTTIFSLHFWQMLQKLSRQILRKGQPKELNIAFIYSAPPRCSRARFFITGRGPRFPAASLPGKHRARAGYMYTSTCTFFTLILFLLTHFAPSFALHVLTQRHIFLAIANTPRCPPYRPIPPLFLRVLFRDDENAMK